MQKKVRKEERGVARALGLGIITGAADDDPVAIGTYASAGATFGTGMLWTAPVTLPMMFAVVYLSAKLGQVSGRGLFSVIKNHYPRWLLWAVLLGVLFGNIVEAAADLGAMGAVLNIFLPVPIPWMAAGSAAVIFAFQLFGSYELIRSIFRWLSLVLLAYVGAALLAKPDAGEVLAGTLIPRIEFSVEFLSILVAVIGTTLSAYLYSWASNQEVEEEISHGHTSLDQRKGATDSELRKTRRDVLIGMVFSNIIMYFIILATGSTLHKAGQTEIDSAAQAAEALRPLAGDAASYLFAAGVIGVGFLAVPIMTTGAAYDLAQTLGWRNQSLHAKPAEAPRFYIATGIFTLIAVGLNFFGFNPMKALVWSGIVQGFSTPPLLLLIMLMTNNAAIMGDRVNGRSINILGWTTTVAVFSASIGLFASFLI